MTEPQICWVLAVRGCQDGMSLVQLKPATELRNLSLGFAWLMAEFCLTYVLFKSTDIHQHCCPDPDIMGAHVRLELHHHILSNVWMFSPGDSTVA